MARALNKLRYHHNLNKKTPLCASDVHRKDLNGTFCWCDMVNEKWWQLGPWIQLNICIWFWTQCAEKGTTLSCAWYIHKADDLYYIVYVLHATLLRPPACISCLFLFYSHSCASIPLRVTEWCVLIRSVGIKVWGRLMYLYCSNVCGHVFVFFKTGCVYAWSESETRVHLFCLVS